MDIYQILLQVLILKLQRLFFPPFAWSKNIYKHTQVTVTWKRKEICLYFYHYFGALFNQNYLFNYHNLLSPKRNYNFVTFLCVAMVRWKIIKRRLDGSSASKCIVSNDFSICLWIKFQGRCETRSHTIRNKIFFFF